MTLKGSFFYFSSGSHLVYPSGTILAILAGSLLSIIPVKTELNRPKGLEGVCIYRILISFFLFSSGGQFVHQSETV